MFSIFSRKPAPAVPAKKEAAAEPGDIQHQHVGQMLSILEKLAHAATVLGPPIAAAYVKNPQAAAELAALTPLIRAAGTLIPTGE